MTFFLLIFCPYTPGLNFPGKQESGFEIKVNLVRTIFRWFRSPQVGPHQSFNVKKNCPKLIVFKTLSK